MQFKGSSVRWNRLSATLEAPLRLNCAFPPSLQTRGLLPSVHRQTPTTLRKELLVKRRHFCFQPRMGRPIFLLLSSLHFSSAFIVRAGRCPEYVMGMQLQTWLKHLQNILTCFVSKLKFWVHRQIMLMDIFCKSFGNFIMIVRHDQFRQGRIPGAVVWICQCVWVLPGFAV